MKMTIKVFLVMVVVWCLCLLGVGHAKEINYAFDLKNMADMSDFDPNNPVIPTGDTIKIAVVASFSGPAALSGQIFWLCVNWAAHDVNKRGGILVDGKRKFVQVIKADHQSRPDVCKKVCERMVLKEKVHVLWGTDGSHLQKVMNQVADKYKVIALGTVSSADELMDAKNFTRYAFMTCVSAEQMGRAFAYFYGQIRKKEKKFYILCQDYLYGHSLAEAFKKGLKEYYPKAEIVGEDYHRLFLTDFAPYLTKIKASGAEVIYTGDWMPDAANLLKQARRMGIKLPFANIYLTEPNFLHTVGVEGTKGLVTISQYGTEAPAFKTPEQIKVYRMWHDLWEHKWKAPYNTRLYEHVGGNIGSWIVQTYWFFDVMKRAGSTKAEKIIKVFEGDVCQFSNGKIVEMRACDHKVIQDLHIQIFVPPAEQKEYFNIPPYYAFKGCCSVGLSYRIPREKILPKADPELCP